MGNSIISGTVKWYNSEKGFGFITAANLEKDVFLHVKQLRASGITDSVNEGEAVTFAVNQGPKGSFATDITRKGGNGAIR